MSHNFSLKPGDFPTILNIHGHGAVVVTSFFNLVKNRYRGHKCYTLQVGENGVIRLNEERGAFACRSADVEVGGKLG